MGDGESGDDLEEREEAAAPEQQCPQEEEMVVAGQDVLDPEAEEAPLLAGGLASSEGDARLPCLGGEGEFADLPARLDLGERVVIGAENVEQIVADGQLPNVGRTGEVHDERHAVGLGAPGVDKALRRLASAALVDEDELVAEMAEQPVAAVRAPGALGERTQRE